MRAETMGREIRDLPRETSEPAGRRESAKGALWRFFETRVRLWPT
jgi:hypothetical protein